MKVCILGTGIYFGAPKLSCMKETLKHPLLRLVYVQIMVFSHLVKIQITYIKVALDLNQWALD